MFICEPCMHDIGIGRFAGLGGVSFGRCEWCDKPAKCADIHHSHIPDKRPLKVRYRVSQNRWAPNIWLINRLNAVGEIQSGGYECYSWEKAMEVANELARTANQRDAWKTAINE